MEKINISEEFAKDISEALNKTEKKAHRVVELQIAGFNDKLKELDNHRDSLVDMMLNKQIDKELFDQQIKRIRSNRDSLAEQLEAHQKSLTSAVIETAKNSSRTGYIIKIIMDYQITTRTTRVLRFDTLEPNFRWFNCAIYFKKTVCCIIENE